MFISSAIALVVTFGSPISLNIRSDSARIRSRVRRGVFFSISRVEGRLARRLGGAPAAKEGGRQSIAPASLEEAGCERLVSKTLGLGAAAPRAGGGSGGRGPHRGRSGAFGSSSLSRRGDAARIAG